MSTTTLQRQTRKSAFTSTTLRPSPHSFTNAWYRMIPQILPMAVAPRQPGWSWGEKLWPSASDAILKRMSCSIATAALWWVRDQCCRATIRKAILMEDNPRGQLHGTWVADAGYTESCATQTASHTLAFQNSSRYLCLTTLTTCANLEIWCFTMLHDASRCFMSLSQEKSGRVPKRKTKRPRKLRWWLSGWGIEDWKRTSSLWEGR